LTATLARIGYAGRELGLLPLPVLKKGWGEGLTRLESEGPSPLPSQPKSDISDFGHSKVTELG